MYLKYALTHVFSLITTCCWPNWIELLSDTIVVMDKGKVVEMGSHSTLIAAEAGLYSRIFRLQSFEETS